MTAARALLAFAAVLLSATLVVRAVEAGQADSLVSDANATMESPAWRKSPPSLDAWLHVRNELLEAQSLSPNNPGVLESLGVLHARRASSPEMLSYARDYFAQSIERRPTSPYTWANYAETRYLIGDTGPGFERALSNAATMGPWEPEVQHVIADIGLATFNELRPETRAQVTSLVGYGMRRNPLEILQIAEKRGRLDVACPYAKNNRRLTDARFIRLCEKGSTT